MTVSILVADSLHINKKNFASFFKFIEQTKPKIVFENTHKDWWSLFGNYESKQNILCEKIEILSKLPPETLFAYKMYDTSLFDVCRTELLAFVSVQEIWFNTAYPTNSRAIFDKLFEYNRISLLQNMAAAWYWLSFWKQKIIESPRYHFCCIFSGSLIYQRTLMEILKFTPTKVMVMESLFTGNEYYCEERYSPIANRCDVMHTAVYEQLLQKLRSSQNLENERMKAINKMILMKNKNVQQLAASQPLIFQNNKPVVTIIGQVVNDFSLLEINGCGISSIKCYKDLIALLTQAGLNVVLKTHPWESEKTNVKSQLTYGVMSDFVKTLPKKQQELIHLVGNYSIKQLFNQSTYVIGLCSQGLIEAAFEGFKPIQLGKAFFGGKGFTYDYKLNQLEELVNDLKEEKIKPLLSLSEYDQLETFLTVLLQKHAISVFDSGLPLLKERFKIPVVIPLSEPKVAVSLLATEQNNIAKIDKVTESVINPNELLSTSPKMQKVDSITTSTVQTVKNVISKKITQRKWNKFKKNPRLFLLNLDILYCVYLNICFLKEVYELHNYAANKSSTSLCRRGSNCSHLLACA